MSERNALQHAGVKGMKWGVRKDDVHRVSVGGKARPGSKAARLQEARSMGDKELRERINRIRMESEYMQVTTAAKTAGRDRAMRVLKTFGKVALKGVAVAAIVGAATGAFKNKDFVGPLKPRQFRVGFSQEQLEVAAKIARVLK